jgi:hypothetical protein
MECTYAMCGVNMRFLRASTMLNLCYVRWQHYRVGTSLIVTGIRITASSATKWNQQISASAAVRQERPCTRLWVRSSS